MPNYVAIKCEFTGYQEHIEMLFEKIKSENYLIDFNKIAPKPLGIFHGNLSSKHEKLYSSKNCWYDWNINNWGTKWNSMENVRKENVLYFQTAWRFPKPIFENISRYIHFNEYDVNLNVLYADENTGYNTGSFVYEYKKDEFQFMYTCFENESNEAYKAVLSAWEYDKDHWALPKIKQDENGNYYYESEEL